VPLAGLEPARCFHHLILSHTLNDCQEVADIVDRGLDCEQWAAIVLIDRKAQPITSFLSICSKFVGLAGALTFDRRDDLPLSFMKLRFIR
jgi:hypothetical protein